MEAPRSSRHDAPVWAITGHPGAGKTTLSDRLSAEYGRVVISSHDLVEIADPRALVEGRLADRAKIAAAFDAVLRDATGPLIVDGWPRTPDQVGMLPAGSLVFALRCTREIAIERILRRGRPDDTDEIAARRYDEQAALLEGQWIREATTHTRSINTTYRHPDHVFDTFALYVDGKRREIY